MSEKLILTESYIAGADLSTLQNCIMKFSAANTVVVCGDGENACGVLMDNPKQNQAAGVIHIGVHLVKVNGNSVNIAAGDPIQSAANGVGVKATTDKKMVIGFALTAATADGVLIPVLLTGGYMNSI